MAYQTQYPAKPVVFAGDGVFFKTLRARVNDHFVGRNRRDDPRLIRKAVIVLVWFFGSYALALTVRSGWLQLLFCFSYALAACALGFNVFHDSTHGSFSSSARVNTFLSRLTSTVLGAGRYFWWYKHNILHHSFTNIFQWDDDVETRGWIRMSPRQPWQRRFKNQHLFFFFLYGMNTIEWFFVKDFVQYFTLKINPYQPIPAMSTPEKVEFWISKLIYYSIFVVLPFLILPAGRVIIGLLLFHVTLSLALGFIFNLAHAIEKTDFPVPSVSARIEDEWAAHQMKTTVNFATRNGVLNWFAGGLNFQIEHHLFPLVSHTHYPDIAGIVKQTAHEFGLPYHSYETYVDTVKSHYRLLRDLGLEPRRV